MFYLSKSFVIDISSWWLENFWSFSSDGSVLNVRQEIVTAGKEFAKYGPYNLYSPISVSEI